MTIWSALNPHASHVTSGAKTAASSWSGLVSVNSPPPPVPDDGSLDTADDWLSAELPSSDDEAEVASLLLPGSDVVPGAVVLDGAEDGALLVAGGGVTGGVTDAALLVAGGEGATLVFGAEVTGADVAGPVVDGAGVPGSFVSPHANKLLAIPPEHVSNIVREKRMAIRRLDFMMNSNAKSEDESKRVAARPRLFQIRWLLNSPWRLWLVIRDRVVEGSVRITRRRVVHLMLRGGALQLRQRWLFQGVGFEGLAKCC